jgi:hypothetical protein
VLFLLGFDRTLRLAVVVTRWPIKNWLPVTDGQRVAVATLLPRPLVELPSRDIFRNEPNLFQIFGRVPHASFGEMLFDARLLGFDKNTKRDLLGFALASTCAIADCLSFSKYRAKNEVIQGDQYRNMLEPCPPQASVAHYVLLFN